MDYYNYYELLFSLRKEYLKNQRIINELLSHIRITNNPNKEYDANLLFKSNGTDNIDSLILIVKKRQSCIRLLLDSLYSSIIYGDSNLKAGCFSYSFRLSKNYVYLLDDNQDGRYLDARIKVSKPKEFIELYNHLFKNILCKNGRTYLVSENELIRLSNNGIHLLNVENNDYKNSTRLDYDGIDDTIITNNPSNLERLMELKINKDIVPVYFRDLIDRNMDSYSYTIEGCEEFYTIEGFNSQLVLKPTDKKGHLIRQ